jgi:hypothetical protein
VSELNHRGRCHCGQIAFEVEGNLEQALECNCSHCSRKGYLLWFVPRTQFTPLTREANLATYTFNKHVIRHPFCLRRGCAPFASGKDRAGTATAAINVRCLTDVDLASVKRVQVDGRSF